MFIETLTVLANVSLDYGLIGIDEYAERIHVAFWLEDPDPSSADPRHPFPETGRDRELEQPAGGTSWAEEEISTIGGRENKKGPSRTCHVFKKRWYFTKSDPGPYPSVPHGHHSSSNAKWPKLNPYTGRIFSNRHQETVAQRLSKSDMQLLWRDQNFRDFCRQHILWYLENHRHYVFPVTNPLRLPRW